MGGEGSMMQANLGLRNNRAPLKRKRSRGVGLYTNKDDEPVPQYIKPSPEELQQIKARIHAKAKRIRQKELFIYFLVSLLSLGRAIFLFTF